MLADPRTARPLAPATARSDAAAVGHPSFEPSVRRALGRLFVALALLAGGCGHPPAEESSAVPPPAAAEPEPELSPDERLAEDVRQAFLQAPALANENVRIAVVQGKVFLMGEVSAPHLRDEAVTVAGEVPGVGGVDSKLNVRRR